MEIEKIFEVLLYAVPSLITGMIAYYFFKEHTKNEDGRRRFLLHKDMQVNAMPLRLQAYERMLIFCDRINPVKLVMRILPNSDSKENYKTLTLNLFSHLIIFSLRYFSVCFNSLNVCLHTLNQ